MRKQKKHSGFSLLELLVSVAVMLIIMGAALTFLAKDEQVYQGTQVVANLHRGVRSALELASQEIGQAGYLGSAEGQRQITSNVIGSPLLQTVSVSSTNSLFIGEKLLVDTGANQEMVTVTGVIGSSVSGIFTRSHTANTTQVAEEGAFGTGVLSGSTATTLQMFGDINSDGTLVYEEYTCDAGAGTLTRSTTPINSPTKNAPDVLLSNLVANPGGTPCFQYQTTNFNGTAYVTRVTVTLTGQEAAAEIETNTRRTLTSSLTVAPHNVLMALALAQASPAVTDRLQPTPPGLPLP